MEEAKSVNKSKDSEQSPSKTIEEEGSDHEDRDERRKKKKKKVRMASIEHKSFVVNNFHDYSEQRQRKRQKHQKTSRRLK